MENKNTSFDILELLEQEKNKESDILLNASDFIQIDKINQDDVLSEVDKINDLEMKNDFIQEIILNNSDQCNNTNDTLKSEDIIHDIKTENLKISSLTKIIDSVIFLFKYLATSSLIFVFLLTITNYSAYIEIARSYLNPEILEKNKQNLLSSVN
jgi:hypothetical protein